MNSNIDRALKAKLLFEEGYNCAQSVFLAFEDLHGMDRKTATMIASPFGGGMGRLREVCGAFSGMLMVLGCLSGYEDPHNYEEKSKNYMDVQLLAKEFAECNGSYICRNLLGLDSNIEFDPKPEPRTKEYYNKRPCKDIVASATEILDNYLKEKL